MADSTGKVALVTGAARGIGRGIALRLAADGHDVAVNDLDSMRGELDAVAEEIKSAGVKSAGVKSTAVVADVSSKSQVDGMVESVAGELGSLDIMVANAGIAQVKAILDVSPEDLDRMYSVNIKGVVLCYQAAARQMISQGSGGKIIGAASIAAHKGFGLLGHYSASRFAVRGFTQAAAQEWAEYGITVNAYCPGIVDTAMWELIDEGIADIQGGTAEKGAVMNQFVESLVTLGRVQTPEDVASFVSYLASRDSDYMTGQSVMIDGGVIFA